jgi:hypothetical protein
MIHCINMTHDFIIVFVDGDVYRALCSPFILESLFSI